MYTYIYIYMCMSVSKIAGTVMMQLSPHYDEKCKGLLEVMEKAVYEEM